MNEVEKYQRETGKWRTPVCTDWLGRATKGSWWPNYYAAWLNHHDHREVGPGNWAPDTNYNNHWCTETPEWDREWFLQQGVRPPRRFQDKSDTYWEDCGGGLSRLSCKTPETPGSDPMILAAVALAAVLILLIVVAI